MRIKMDQFEISKRSRINKTVILDLVKLNVVIKQGKTFRIILKFLSRVIELMAISERNFRE